MEALLISVACLVFPFSLLWPSLLTCSDRAGVTATRPKLHIWAASCSDSQIELIV